MSSLTSPISLPITLPQLALAGVIGQISFEAYAWLVSPIFFGDPLQPSNLVVALTKLGTGIELPHLAAFLLHFTIGSGFVLGVWALHRMFKLRMMVAGVLTGLVLWFVAQGILAPVVGRSFMMDWGPYTQSSFIGHVGMTTVMAYVLKRLTAGRSVVTAA